MRTIPHFDFSKKKTKPKKTTRDLSIGDQVTVDCTRGRVTGEVVSLLGNTVLHIKVKGEVLAAWRKNVVQIH